MAINRFVDRKSVSAAEAHLARVADTGSARHAHLSALVEASGPNAPRDIADAIHLLCAIHGSHPGVVQIAQSNALSGPASQWLSRATDAFERERLYLVRLTSAVGPVPSTPGAAETESALLAQRHALETLARSERSGCALGAATALVADWAGLRPLLDKVAVRVGVDVPPCSLPGGSSIADVLEAGASSAAAERAIRFGAEQLLLQQRALFDLLEARSEAREDY